MSSSAFILLLKALDLLVLGIEMAPNIRALFSGITASVRLMTEEGRDPTSAEWAQLGTLRDTIHQKIQEVELDHEEV